MNSSSSNSIDSSATPINSNTANPSLNISAFPNNGGELLIIIVDCNPVWWDFIQKNFPPQTRLGSSNNWFIHVWQSLLAFSNAHLSLSAFNELAIIGVLPSQSDSVYLFSSLDDASSDPSTAMMDSKLEILAFINRIVRERLGELLNNYQYQLSQNFEMSSTLSCYVSGAISKALSYCSRRFRKFHSLSEKHDASETMLSSFSSHTSSHNVAAAPFTSTSHILNSNRSLNTNKIINNNSKFINSTGLTARILVVRGSYDAPCQYLQLMNCVFAAQKLMVPIDVCHLIPPSLNQGLESITESNICDGSQSVNLLQQECKLTGGIYVPVSNWHSLLQYLNMLLLPRASSFRKSLILSAGFAQTLALKSGLISKHVDSRAACFCHKRLIETGYMCSVCLTIFCSFSPFCTVCYAHFKLPRIPPSASTNKSTTNSIGDNLRDTQPLQNGSHKKKIKK